MDEKTKNKVEENIRLVYFVFGKMAHCSLFFRYKEDLVSEGFIGLIRAAEKFDESRGVKFVSFAATCIHNQILMAVRKLRKQAEHETSLDAPIDTDDDGRELCLLDVLETPTPQFVEEGLDFQTFMETARDKDRYIVRAKQLGYTQKEIGKQLHLSQSYVARRFQRLCQQFRTWEKAV